MQRYNFDGNQVVQCLLYPRPNFAMDQQANPILYQSQNFYSKQHDRPFQAPLMHVNCHTHSRLDDSAALFLLFDLYLEVYCVLQESLINSPFQESMSNSSQLRQVRKKVADAFVLSVGNRFLNSSLIA